MKAFALAGAALGHSVRQIERTLAGQNNGAAPSKSSIHEWIVAANQSGSWAQARFAAAASLQMMIVDTAAARVMEKLETGDASLMEVNAAMGTAMDKVLAMAKLNREANRDNLLRRALDEAGALDLPTEERRRRLVAIGMPVSFEGTTIEAAPIEDAAIG